jgi:tetratricopeptide (TPR) repeat protein
VEGIVSEYQQLENLIDSQNQQIYQRLQLALNLGLRRQIFVAVCDDPQLQHFLAARLHAELNQQLSAFAVGGPSSSEIHRSQLPQQYPQWVSLNLNVKRPSPIAQIERWLRKHSIPPSLPSPGFQVLGIERLTRQPATRQWRFLENLRNLELSRLPAEASVLLWMPPPWFRTLQGIPEFWQYCTGVFEFDSNHQQHHSQETATFDSETIAPYYSETQTTTEHPDIAQKIEVLFPQKQTYSSTTTPLLANVPEQLLELVKAVAPESVREICQTDLQTAISEYEPFQHLYEIDRLYDSGGSAEETALAYLQLGDFYREFLEQQEQQPPEYAEIILFAYTQAWEFLPSHSPRYWVLANDIGTLYWMLARSTESVETKTSHLEQAVSFFRTAAAITQPMESPEAWYMLQSNLGAIYGELGGLYRSAEYWQQAIHAYQNIQKIHHPSTSSGDHWQFPEQKDPQKKQQMRWQWGTTQNNLGTAYWNLAQYQEPVNSLYQAIAAYKRALKIYTPDTEPLHYAMLQNNLGTAYWNLAQYEEPEDNLLLAVSAYRLALNYRTRDTVPHQCAATQNNLGTAYWHLAYQGQSSTLSPSEYWQQAIAAYEATLELTAKLADSVPLSFDVLATHNNLGLAYYQLQRDSHANLHPDTQQGCLQKALYHHVQAWQGYEQQPELRANTFRFLIQTIRTLHEQFGVEGQNQALSQVPSQLLPEILAKL